MQEPQEVNKLGLYQMTSAMLAVLEADEVDDELMAAAFGDIIAKESRICHFIRDIEAATEAHKAEEKRIADRRKALENKAKQLKGFIQLSMERLGVDKAEAGTFKLALQNNPPSLEIYDKEAVPNEYHIIIPATTEPDKERIKSVLKSGGDVPGARLTAGRSLRIR